MGSVSWGVGVGDDRLLLVFFYPGIRLLWFMNGGERDAVRLVIQSRPLQSEIG